MTTLHIPHHQPRWLMLIVYVALIVIGSSVLTRNSAAQCAPNDFFCTNSLD